MATYTACLVYGVLLDMERAKSRYEEEDESEREIEDDYTSMAKARELEVFYQSVGERPGSAAGPIYGEEIAVWSAGYFEMAGIGRIDQWAEEDGCLGRPGIFLALKRL